ncbi:MAG: SDR family oxidoreductase [Dehalococcoidia bacterium]
MSLLAGKKVLVTGGSSGIGQAIAVRFGQEGANVAINYRGRPEGAEATQEAIEQAVHECMETIRGHGRHPLLVQADVSSLDDIRRMVSEVVAAFGGLDILVNNAGVQVDSPSHEVDVEALDRVLAVNLRGAALCAQHAIAHYIEAGRPGVVLNVSSVHEVIPKPRFLGYSMSKGGMRNLTTTLALEYAAHGIRVNAIGPGATITPINRGWIDDPEKRALVESHIPLGRAGDAEEMAAAAAFLCSDQAAYITGQTLFVDGGLTLYADFRGSWSSE